METNIRGEITVAVDESQFSLKDNDFIRVIASTLRASSAEVSKYFIIIAKHMRRIVIWHFERRLHFYEPLM